MNYVINVLILMSVAVAFVWGGTAITPSEQCQGKSFEDLRERIQVKPCSKNRCNLHKGTNTTVIIKFNPQTDVKTLTNNVNANIGGITLPFIGVDGTDACPQVKRADTGEATGCPLKAGQEYILTNVFPIESFYPSVALRVHWALNAGDITVICFEVPAQIK